MLLDFLLINVSKYAIDQCVLTVVFCEFTVVLCKLTVVFCKLSLLFCKLTVVLCKLQFLFSAYKCFPTLFLPHHSGILTFLTLTILCHRVKMFYI